MAKTILTKKIETALYHYCHQYNQIAVDEVTMHNQGIVDMISLELKGSQTKGYTHIWRCYEIKISAQDFYSKNKLTFLGHFNYFVLPYELYLVVKQDIPKEIGVLTFNNNTITLIKKPKKEKTLKLDESVVLRNVLNSMNREVFKAKQIEKGMSIYTTNELIQEIIKRTNKIKPSFLTKLYMDEYANNPEKLVNLLIDTEKPQEYKTLILSVLNRELIQQDQYIKDLEEELQEQKKLKRNAWLQLNQAGIVPRKE